MFYQDDDDVFVAHFGFGDIYIMGSHLQGKPEIGSVSLIDTCGKYRPIGSSPSQKEWDSIREKCTTDDKLNTVIRLIFDKPESIDVLIEELQGVKAKMVAVGK